MFTVFKPFMLKDIKNKKVAILTFIRKKIVILNAKIRNALKCKEKYIIILYTMLV